MKILIPSLIILLFSIHVFGQQDPVREATYHFTLRNGIFTGNGADTLKKHVGSSQFFLIGEEHDMKELQEFTTSFIPFLKRLGYNNLALEIGPIAATKLRSLYDGKNGLGGFNSKDFKYINGAPFGFFGGREEERFSDCAFENGFQIWGIDFENYNASLFLIDELYRQSKKGPELDKMYATCRQVIIDAYHQDRKDKRHQLASTLLRSKAMEAFFKKAARSPGRRELFGQQILSWKIYEQQSKKNWQPRVDNMKANFASYYRKAAANSPQPKVFIKLGAVHTARGTSSSGFQELGNMVYELANLNRTNAFSVISFARYRIDAKGETTDLLEEEDAELLRYTTKDSWSLVDLKRLGEDGRAGRIKLSQLMRSYMQKYDMMLIPPATKYMEPNFLPQKEK
ncbi:MAG: hypothetical protein EOO45_19745 [Flavobacterium sp.]|nr:MAG: hypothetical protein EOO45_19745 [Flavobacterium sp.]